MECGTDIVYGTDSLGIKRGIGGAAPITLVANDLVALLALLSVEGGLSCSVEVVASVAIDDSCRSQL